MANQDSFINEVTEEVRRDRLFTLFRRYAWIGITIVVLTVAGAAWNEWRKADARAEAQARSIAPCKNCVISRDLSESHDFSAQMRAKRFDPEIHDSLADVDLEGDA